MAKRAKGNPIITRYPPPPGYKGPNQPGAPYSAPSSWHPPPSNLPRNARRHNSAPFPSTRQHPLDGNGDPLPPEDSNADSGNALEAAFDEECYFGRYPDEINPDLSLGSITWKAPLPARRALPGTFQEAELEALAPRIDVPSLDDSVSDYFSKLNGDEALLSIRQTEHWAEMRNDLIFREFPQMCASLMRQDDGGVLDDLEAALQNSNRVSMPPEQRRPPPIRDQGQEDILAALGVTGSPKLVYETPGPAFGPRPTSAAGSEKSAHSRSNSMTSVHGTNGMNGNALDFIPEVVINEDMEPDDMATPRPKKPYAGDTNRKRSYADTGPGAHEEFDDEETPRQKGKHARML
ncbi:uncharacterized protein MYCFIDRAFT_78320 [Pseudocercospora fijiensis CIRAD86]|uniref:Uncharacterized protein n=1 Tax=Pseudocercospora fijiensis (strain CIRAD86) TaxID=383855 RepID=M3ANA0_PSEFD|nr:uncharacterized protein MYCFIDRAFT_78320 [Pseudocercospora fijiensis CIRAD86]EME78608.1 hypothetical protein MYCFIDRAFT_78320 [Pseudocercospora fijiensis CIRAD86]